MEPPDAQTFEPRGRVVLRELWRALEGPGAKRHYVLVRWLVLRSLGFVYAFAFLGAVLQLPGLIGSHGLLPIARWQALLLHVSEGDAWRAFELAPSLLWIDASDASLMAVAWVGLGLSIAVMLGLTNAAAMVVLWVLYMSLETMGQRWYAFGWESQLLETGMLAVFLCPLRGWRPFPERDPPPLISIVLLRWLSFRIWLGAGLIKWRGDSCWQDLTCLDVHFETQPIPNPFSTLFHHLPEPVLAGGVLTNHFVELVVPFMVFGPRRLRLVAAGSMIGFQVVLIVSGNLAFLNWLTIVPAIACLDDAALRRLTPRRWRAKVPVANAEVSPRRVRVVTAGLYAVLVAYLSMPVVANLMNARRQSMNRTYDRLQLVNTYGAFGSIGDRRYELVIEGTEDELGPDAEWKAYAFGCKPGEPGRRPCLVSPYHPRIDWLMWFAGLEVPWGRLKREEAWMFRLLEKLLEAEPVVLDLLDDDPFAGRQPSYVRVRAFRYWLEPPGARDWWRRESVGTMVRPVALGDAELTKILHRHRFE